jgi:hypothetical protein
MKTVVYMQQSADGSWYVWNQPIIEQPKIDYRQRAANRYSARRIVYDIIAEMCLHDFEVVEIAEIAPDDPTYKPKQRTDA